MLYTAPQLFMLQKKEKKNVFLAGKILIKKFSDFIETFVLKKKKKKKSLEFC